MTPPELAASLVERGLDRSELAAKQALFEVVFAAFGKLPAAAGPALGSGAGHLAPARHVWWVPGRLEVFGTHTDYAGGRTLVCAVPKGIAVVARPRAGGVIHVTDARRGNRVTLRRPAGSASFTGWRHYVEVVARRIAQNFPEAAIGADIVFASDLPRASGMSSSSALLCGLASALVRVADIESRPEWHANIHGTLDVAGYYACIENGLSFGTLHGDAGVGTHGGSEDHAGIVATGPGRLSAFAFVPMHHSGSVRVPDDWRFVIAPCGVMSSKTGSSLEPYNRLARGAQLLLELWSGAEAPAPSLGAALASAPGAADRLRVLVRRSSIVSGLPGLAGWSAEALERRLDHFIREDARIPEAFVAFRDADAARLTSLSDESQGDAESLLGNQVPESIALARRARQLGAFAARSFGAGFGGSVWALVQRAEAEAFAQSWHPGAFVAPPSPSLTQL